MDAVSRQSQVERFPPGPKPLPENYRGPRGFKLRPASELEAALGSAQRALRRPDGKPGLHVTKATFEQLCDLAETVTFVKFDAEDASRDRCRNAAEAILLAIGSDHDKSDIVGRLAGSRFDDSQRQSNGIMMAGIVQQAQLEGDLFAIQIILLGCGRSVTVISRQPPTPPVAKRDRLLVLGTIVDSPRENLAGYAGELPQVVWGGLPLKLAGAAP